MKKKRTSVAVSGGFDPLHFGHVRYLTEAKKLGDELVVILNNDNWLKHKKGFAFMPERERLEVLRALHMVDRVVVTKHKPHDPDRSVSKILAQLKPDIFANGGDRNASDAENPKSSLNKDIATCKRLGIRMVFGVGAGGKMQSSSWLVQNVPHALKTDVRPWGAMQVHKSELHYWVKTISVAAGRRTSLQSHAGRSEVWVCVEGDVTAEVRGIKKTLRPGMTITVPKGVRHRLGSKNGGALVEVGVGPFVREDDIRRYEDDFGRVDAKK